MEDPATNFKVIILPNNHPYTNVLSGYTSSIDTTDITLNSLLERLSIYCEIYLRKLTTTLYQLYLEFWFSHIKKSKIIRRKSCINAGSEILL